MDQDQLSSKTLFLLDYEIIPNLQIKPFVNFPVEFISKERAKADFKRSFKYQIPYSY